MTVGWDGLGGTGRSGVKVGFVGRGNRRVL